MVFRRMYIRIRSKCTKTVECIVSLPVRAAGVLCVLGISFGIGTYVLYKIYDRFIRPSVRRKPPKQDKFIQDGENDILESSEEMGNNQSNSADIPVYYKAGFGVSLYNPVDNPKVRNRKTGLKYSGTDEAILKGNLRNKNGLVGSGSESTLIGENGRSLNGLNGGGESYVSSNRAPDLSQLRIKIDESGFVEDDGDDVNVGDKFSNSLKGNYSPVSLCEKNYRISAELGIDIEADSGKTAGSVHESLLTQAKQSGEHLQIGSTLGASSVLLTPPSEDENSSYAGQQISNGSDRQRNQSTKSSDVSDIRNEVAEQPETDDEQEQLSPLPFDNSQPKSPEKLCLRKLKLKLNEIVSQSSNLTSRSNNSSSCTSPDSLSSKRPESSNTDRENSISGISSPELDLLNPENIENPVVYASTFNNLENEIHGVEDEFESLSREIQALSSRYTDNDRGSEILMEIFQRYPSIRVRQAERGVLLNFNPVDSRNVSRGGSRNNSEAGEGSVDLSWDLENMLDMVYTEGSEASQLPSSKGNTPAPHQGQGLSASSVDNSVNCSVELDGSLYEDEFHLHLGTKPLPKIEEHPPDIESAPCSPDYAKMVVNSESSELLSTNPPSTCDVVSANHSESSEMVSAQGSEMDANSNSNSEMYSAAGSKMDSNNSEMFSANGSEVVDGVNSRENVGSDCSNSSDVVNSGNKTMGMVNVGERVEITQYADSEWKGDTQKASLLREAYRAIPSHCQCCHLRRIRGDNYCGIRGTVYQTLVNGLPPLNIWASKDTALHHLNKAYNNKSSGIRKWNFAHRISYTKENKLEIMQRCISTFYAKMEEMSTHSSYTAREQYLVHLLNSDLHCDLDLMEGVKLLMSLSALRLYGDMEQGSDVPVFAWLLFARDSSENVANFIKNHLNQVGNSGGLEQVEMCLLGYSLGVRIRVLRLQQFNDDDFVSYYPEDGTESWPVISLIAEDDRHYNVPVL